MEEESFHTGGLRRKTSSNRTTFGECRKLKQRFIRKDKKTEFIPTGLVVGVIKRQPRTYCGSITQETVEKL